MNLLDFPDELLGEILVRLSNGERFGRLGQTCRRLAALSFSSPYTLPLNFVFPKPGPFTEFEEFLRELHYSNQEKTGRPEEAQGFLVEAARTFLQRDSSFFSRSGPRLFLFDRNASPLL